MAGFVLNITEKQVDYSVEIDWNLLTWGDVQEASAAMEDSARGLIMAGIIARVTGREVATMPAVVVTALAERIVEKIGLGEEERKN